MHGARQGVQLRVVLARGLAEPRRGRGELVPEAIEIDALAARDQPLHVGPAEAEMPEQRVLENLFPRADAGNRRVDQHEAATRSGYCAAKAKPTMLPMSWVDQVGAVDLERVEHAGDVAGSAFFLS